MRAFQLCLALSPADESSQETNERVASQEFDEVGPVRVILGQFGRTRSRISNVHEEHSVHTGLSAIAQGRRKSGALLRGCASRAPAEAVRQ